MSIDATIVIVSYNTRDLLARCLSSVKAESGGLSVETIVVDNGSIDGSAELVERDWPGVVLLRPGANLGFAAANNLAFKRARGRYIVLLNSDAFLQSDSLLRAVQKMDANPGVALAGARLIGEDGAWQPSARMFPSLATSLFLYTGLSSKYPSSRLFGQYDRTWASPDIAAEVDWVPGAFAILRRDVLTKVGDFDESFFLYYEEVDLCRRIKQAGYKICYWPDVVVVHVGGQSAKQAKDQGATYQSSQLTLWRMRSELLYHRKHHGWLGAYSILALETLWHRIRLWKLSFSNDPHYQAKKRTSEDIIRLKWRAWRETAHGTKSPPRPWILD